MIDPSEPVIPPMIGVDASAQPAMAADLAAACQVTADDANDWIKSYIGYLYGHEPWPALGPEPLVDPGPDDDGFAAAPGAPVRGNSLWTDDPAMTHQDNGILAARNHHPLTACPHPPDSPEGKDWTRGWVLARQEQEIYSGRAERRTIRADAIASADLTRPADPTEALLGPMRPPTALRSKPDPTAILDLATAAEAFQALTDAVTDVFTGVAQVFHQAGQAIRDALIGHPIFRMREPRPIWHHVSIDECRLPEPDRSLLGPARRGPAPPIPLPVLPAVDLRAALPPDLLTDHQQRGPQLPVRPTRRAPADLRGVRWGHGTRKRREHAQRTA